MVLGQLGTRASPGFLRRQRDVSNVRACRSDVLALAPGLCEKYAMTKQLLVAAVAAGLVVAADLPGRAQAGRAFTTDFTPQEFAGRRAKIYDAIGADAVALMQGLPTVHSSAVFRQSNEFYYVTGVVAPQALVLMDGATR